MNQRSFPLLAALLICLPLNAAGPARGAWELLSTETIGAKGFRDAHSEWDGRGVLIAVCDTGTDLSLRGLLETTEGKPKVLDARVFSSEGRISLEWASFSKDERGEAVHGKDGRWLFGFDKLPLKPLDRRRIFVGYFAEEKFKNSGMEDLNGDGKKDGTFGLVAFETGEGAARHWAAFVDTNADGDLADEVEIRDYVDARQAFSLRGRDTHSVPEAAQFALNLWPEEKEAALYMDDGAHGTHVAGIAAGFRIDGQEGYDGIAPGAQLLALKIGNCTLTGGATTPGSMVSAWRYAVKKAAELNMPLVIQMSFGTGSESRGASEAERILDRLLEENPGVVATLSAGNEGPGLATVGNPAGMKHALSVAAALAKTTSRDLYGVDLAQDELFSFSSRGGEVSKPDIACPGFAASTVPMFEKGHNIMRGTSMAAPQAAGACALIMSAAVASSLPVRRDWIVASFRRSARPIAGYGLLDCGAGMANVPGAWEIYRDMAKGDPSDPVLYEAEAESPDHSGGKGPSVFWRGFFPRKEVQEVTVRPLWPAGVSADVKARFYRAFDFECRADWLRLQGGTGYIKAEMPAKIRFTFDEIKLAGPGLYQTSIDCWAKGSSRKAGRGPDLAIPVAVVVPQDIGTDRPFSVALKDLEPAKVHRIFFRITPEMGSLVMDLTLPDRQKGTVSAVLFDPEGREAWAGTLKPENRKVRKAFLKSSLDAGTWELTLTANYANLNPVEATLRVLAVPMAVPLPEEIPVNLRIGHAPEATLTLATAAAVPLRGHFEGQVAGCVQRRREDISGCCTSRTFSVLPGESSVEFGLELSPEDFNLFTDIAVQIVDKDGTSLVQDGLTNRRGKIEFAPDKGAPETARYTLKVLAAAADPDAKPNWTLKMTELHRYLDPVKVTMADDPSGGMILYPDRAAEAHLVLSRVPPAVPEGAAWLVECEVRDSSNDLLRVPIEFRLIAASGEAGGKETGGE